MRDGKLEILILDDDTGDRRQIKRALREAELPCVCTEAASIGEALEAGAASAFDCAFVDYRLPGEDGLTGITALHERLPYMAIVMVTGHGDEAVATDAMKRGASDYLRKTDITAESIRRSIENSVEKVTLLRTVAEQREELEVFSRVLVHDLKAPIHTILGFSALIEERIANGEFEELGRYCGLVSKGVRRMSLLIDTLYLYTKADALLELKPLDMGEVLVETLSNLEHLIRERGAGVTFGGMPVVFGTPQLTQLLQNLIANGIKYSKAEVPRVHVAAALQEPDKWLFSVKDNGIGIPMEHYRDVFEPFRRLHAAGEYEGTGLGLATCKKIVERHLGRIWCESRDGQGTTFFFTLTGEID